MDNNQIHQELKKTFKFKNVMQVPKLEKIVVNCGLGEAVGDKKIIDSMKKQLEIITGQSLVITKARKAISSFKLREGDSIGLKVTLRGKRMYHFLNRLICMALPRVRDFRGVSVKSFDGNGNYTLAVREQIIFPELDYKLIDKTRGFEITFVTTALNDIHAKGLLKALGMPFEKEEVNK